MSDKELLFSVTKKDLDITWFSGTGNGGQYRNKHQNCCRIIHRESSAMGTGQSQRDRQSNLKEALINLTKDPKFRAWVKLKTREATGVEAQIKETVNRAMNPDNLIVEVQENGKWAKENPSS